MTRPAIVLQARMGSTRLPGKVLASIDGRPLVAHCIARLSRSGLPVIVATTDRPDDDELCGAVSALGAPIVRGPGDDVLARYVLAAESFGLTHVIRATADNPAVDPDAPRRVLDLLLRTGVSYVSEYGLPLGAAVEACTADALALAHAVSTDPYDREHVTPFLRRDSRIVSIEALAPAALRRPDIRLTVDRPDDLALVRDIFGVLGSQSDRAGLDAVIEAADEVRARQLAAGAVGR